MGGLAPYAVKETNSRGRRIPEPPHPYRSEFDRDRDRIIHSAAFRRLEGKTQVFTVGLNDHYRTRLTHTIEVAQIGRTIAKNLKVNESLTEAICLAHDLGHPPFGHTGETVLNELMAEYGGFEHNAQSIRIVDFLEHPYPDFYGLNLMYETRLGLLKHSTPYDTSSNSPLWPVRATIEGQIADLADRIAYNCHDLEDGLRARLIEIEQLESLQLFGQVMHRQRLDLIDDPVIRRTRLAKGILDILASDAIQTSSQRIIAAKVSRWQDIVEWPEPLVELSSQSEHNLRELELFLSTSLYQHSQLVESANQAAEKLKILFDFLVCHPHKMPRYFQHLVDSQGLFRTVCDYIAGMTDRFCLELTKSL